MNLFRFVAMNLVDISAEQEVTAGSTRTFLAVMIGTFAAFILAGAMCLIND